MSAGAWIKFDKSLFYGLDSTIDYSDTSAGAFKCALVLSTWTAASTADTWADISAHEHGAANGYTAGGEALTSVVLSNSSGVDKWDSADISWTASGGNITALYAVIYHVSSGKLIRYCQLEETDKTSIDGNDFVIQLASGGIFDIT